VTRDTLIDAVDGRAVYDSNGMPTIEVTLRARSGRQARAFAQRGSSTGRYEVRHLERAEALPALDAVRPALASLHSLVRPALVGVDVTDQPAVDACLDSLDATPDRSVVGGNVLVATSMAAAELGARSTGQAPFRHLAPDLAEPRLPQPTFNIIDGSTAPFSMVAHHEFLVFPAPGTPVAGAVEMAVRIRDRVRRRLHDLGETAGDSPQGAVVAVLPDVPAGLGLLTEAADHCGYAPGRDFHVGLDMAAADVVRDDRYAFGWAREPLDADELAALYRRWMDEFPLRYLEDGFAEEHGAQFAALRRLVPEDVVVAGDDLFASNPERVAAGVRECWADAVVLKPNQVGTVSALLRAGRLAAEGGMEVMLSQRSGENDSALIVHLGVAAGATYVKCGGPSRLDRVIKLNEMIRLEAHVPVRAGAARSRR
jgi:enolase